VRSHWRRRVLTCTRRENGSFAADFLSFFVSSSRAPSRLLLLLLRPLMLYRLASRNSLLRFKEILLKFCAHVAVRKSSQLSVPVR
jgi:hypothetical protein